MNFIFRRFIVRKCNLFVKALKMAAEKLRMHKYILIIYKNKYICKRCLSKTKKSRRLR